MPKGIPTSSGRPDIAPIQARRIANAPIVNIGAFKSMQRRKNDKTGEEYEVEQVKLSIDFDSGHIMRDPDGNPVLDDDGNEQPHLLNEGFVTLSGNNKAKFVEILRALGLDGPEFIQSSGRDKGALTQEAAESLEAEFGVNGLGDDYSGMDWDDLPFYVLPSKGGTEKKRDVEVPVTSLKILGREIIGRWLDASIKIDGDWNRFEAFLVSENPAPVDQMIVTPPNASATPATSMPKEAAKPASNTNLDNSPDDTPLDKAPFDPDDQPKVNTKGQKYVLTQLQEAQVPTLYYVRVAQLASGFDDFDTLGDMSTEACRNFRDMVKAAPETIQDALTMAMEGTQTGDEADAEDEDEDF